MVANPSSFAFISDEFFMAQGTIKIASIKWNMKMTTNPATPARTAPSQEAIDLLAKMLVAKAMRLKQEVELKNVASSKR